MKIIDLINKVKQNKITNTQYKPHAIDDFIKENVSVKMYVPFVEKRELCKKVLDASCNKNGSIIEVDSVSRYLLFTLAVISKYTNLEFSSGADEEFDSIDEYDMLCQNGLLNPILDIIGTEYTTCNNILNMMMADIEANNNNSAIVLDKALQQILGYVDNFANTLENKVESLNLDLSQIDIDKYKDIVDKITK